MTRAVAALFALVLSMTASGYEAIRTPTTHYHYDIGVAAIEEQAWQRAVDNLRLVVKDEPRNPDAHDWLGHAYAKLGQPDLAQKHLREALRLDRRHHRAHLHLGELQLARGEKARATETLASLRKLCATCEETAELGRAVAAAR